MPRGISFKPSEGQVRVTLECPHQHGRLYIVGAEMNWVCSASRRPAHSLSGFFGELVMEFGNQRVKELMQRWGIYYRRLPQAEKKGRRIKVEE